MTRPIRALLLSLAFVLGGFHASARAQEEAVDPNAPAAGAEGGGGSAFMGYAAAGFFVGASIFAICKTARRS